MANPTPFESLIGKQFSGESNKKDFGLSPLEKQLIALIAAGYSSKETGQEIGVSARTVCNLLRRIFTKLQVTNRLELVLFVAFHHLLDTAQTPPPVPEVSAPSCAPEEPAA
jgi:DNA-binding CsgD family transcriptional regulator